MTVSLKNRDEFKKLYLDTYGVMVNFAYSKTSDWELSKEIVQKTFVKFWNNRENIIIRSSVKSYLFSMVRNNIIDHYRKVERVTDLESINKSELQDIDHLNNKDESLIELKYNLKIAISKLKEKRRKIFELSKYEGLTYKEISDYLNISERAVEDNISKAFIQIRKYFIENNLEKV